MVATGTSNRIPFTDVRLEPEDIEAVAEVLRSGWLTLGPRTQAFEDAFAAHLGVRHAVAVSSCTAALHLAYLAAGIGPGDEAIVPSMTFAATANAVLYCGGRPVFADIVGSDDFGIDPDDVERRIGPRTKAVCAVHFAGYPAAVDRLRELCDARGVALIEDAAHAPSATLGRRKLGTWGLAGAFSFFSNKILSCGEGGLLATDDDEVAARARRLRSHGMSSGSWSRFMGQSRDYDVEGLGFNYRLDEPRAALLLSRLARLEADIARRRELTRRYRSRLAAVDGLTVPYEDEGVGRSSCYVMPVLVADPARRDYVRTVMEDEHLVQTSIFYPALHELTAYRRRLGSQRLPATELVGRTEITIPLYPHMDAPAQDRVIAALEEALAR
jgi:dTDP-4-amino-4,6-dideoxygalactose transaminase